MFGMNSKSTAKIKTTSNGIDSIISKGTSVSGPIIIRGSIKIEGEVFGSITNGASQLKSNTLILIDAGGKIHGDSTAENVIIHGTVIGDISANSVYLGSKANVIGNINYKILQIEPGAIFTGEMKLTTVTTNVQLIKEAV